MPYVDYHAVLSHFATSKTCIITESSTLELAASITLVISNCTIMTTEAGRDKLIGISSAIRSYELLNLNTFEVL